MWRSHEPREWHRDLDAVAADIRDTADRMVRTVRGALGLATLAVLGSIAWLWIKHRYGFETLGQFWEFLSH